MRFLLVYFEEGHLGCQVQHKPTCSGWDTLRDMMLTLAVLGATESRPKVVPYEGKGGLR